MAKQEMTLDEARACLGLTQDAVLSLDGLKEAFRLQLFKVHPDTADMVDAAGNAAHTVDRLRVARALLMIAVTEPKTRQCPKCKGQGCSPGRLGVIPCTRCDGTGEIV